MSSEPTWLWRKSLEYPTYEERQCGDCLTWKPSFMYKRTNDPACWDCTRIRECTPRAERTPRKPLPNSGQLRLF